jgi:two-component system, NtrC family, sensor kinase
MRFLTLILCFFYLSSYAQQTDDFHLDRLPTEGVLLVKNWKWHAGDNPDFAKADFDDSGWEGIDPTQSLPQLKKIDTQQPLWLRIKLTDLPQNIALSIKQSGATEIFLNGKLIKSYGKIDTQGTHTLAFTPVDEYILGNLDSTQNTLAVRYYFQKGIRYKAAFDVWYPLFHIKLFPINSLHSNIDRTKYVWEGFNIASSTILFLIHFILFLFYPPTRANLWYSLWALLGAIGGCLLLAEKSNGYLHIKNQLTLINLLISPISLYLLFYTIYILLKQTKRIFLWVFASLSILATYFYFFSINGEEQVFNLMVNFSNGVFVIYMAYNAYKKGNKGGLYVMIGMLIFIVFWAIFILIFANTPQIEPLEDIIFHAAILTLPITISTLLGLDFSNTNRNLIKNLLEVNRLSAENHQILATQNETLEKLVEERTVELKASQNQLIQKEKLASLGELTAGIAHEIQNPLNFVNNFSELSVDLLKDLKDELKRPDKDETYIDELFDDLSSNQEKINHHGKRASSIVKGMLEHSRASTGVKELTDINKLADEYLRLAYHGLRAKDKDFNADFKTDFDESLPKIEVIPQDIGRVLLNLINNAFWAVNHRKLHSSDEIYTPSVLVTTKQLENAIEIRVKDNGTGMPESVKTKVFQPFFTTKPTGEGTGLGLSLAYDIVTKGHGGALEVVSTEGVGTEFIILLPNHK